MLQAPGVPDDEVEVGVAVDRRAQTRVVVHELLLSHLGFKGLLRLFPLNVLHVSYNAIPMQHIRASSFSNMGLYSLGQF